MTDVRAERRGRLGLLTLDRPAALNALTQAMIDALRTALETWRVDPAIETVVIRGAGDRGLCAGGDVVVLAAGAAAGDTAAAARFWGDEYRLNAAIARYPKPIVALQDGIVLGGGVGISAHASHRVVTERSRVGLPETGIGFVPDVGSTWLLSRAPGEVGTRLGLSGIPVGPADAIHAGLADVLVPSARLSALVDALEREAPDAALPRFTEPPGPSALAADRAWSDPAFALDAVPAIIAALRRLGTDEATVLADTIASRSPTATAVTLEALRRARALRSLEAALDAEYRVSMHALQSHDFAEGVRAQLVDKDRTPVWSPSARDAVTPASVQGYFAARPGDELGLSPSPPR